MKPEIAKLLQKAARSIEAAEALLQRGDYDFAVARAYYAMFYLAEALLLEKDLRFKTHHGVITAFGKHFIQPGIFPAELYRWLRTAYNARLVGDYDVDAVFTPEGVATLIEQARRFMHTVRPYLEHRFSE
ncbi:HEPN domain-containing protein [Rhodothermus marinus]|jgi:uncharacterized protein (UPF0332 family)|uniref:HEPN domain-containing protein n=1 Tax=Rhodothermus marinus TaxID=29549 RepID=UPI0006D19C07|nr:HEPN domain-containing protein [Rhodothermus marinus]